MKKFIIFMNIILALYLGFNLYALNQRLHPAHENDFSGSDYDFTEVSIPKPELLDQYPPIFDLRAPSAAIAIASRDDNNMPDTLIRDHTRLRVRGIFGASGIRFAVFELTSPNASQKPRSPSLEMVRAAPGDTVKDLTITGMDSRTVTLTGPDGETIQLKIFKQE